MKAQILLIRKSNNFLMPNTFSVFFIFLTMFVTNNPVKCNKGMFTRH